jgi:phage-related minor tail protein
LTLILIYSYNQNYFKGGSLIISRPCDELKKEIANLKRSLADVKEHLKNPNYDEEQKAMLKHNIEGYKEMLRDFKEELKNCK